MTPGRDARVLSYISRVDQVIVRRYINFPHFSDRRGGLFSVVTVIDAVSAAILPVWVDFTSLKGLPCAPGPATTRRGMLVTNG